MSRTRALGITVPLLALALAAEWAALARTSLEAPLAPTELPSAAADLVAGAVLAGSGLAAWHRRPENRTGPLLTAAALAWFLGTFSESGVGWIAAIGGAFVTLHRGPLMHAMIAYPSGRIDSRLGRVAAAAAWGTAAVPALGESPVATIVMCVLVLAAIVQHATRSAPRERVAVARSLAIAAALSIVLTAGAVAALGGASAGGRLLVAYELVTAMGAVWLAHGVIHPRWTEAAVTSLVVQLGSATNGSLEERLANALGDPALRVGYSVPGRSGFVDAAGRPVALPEGTGEQVTFVGRDRIAVLVCDARAAHDPALLESVAAAARIAVGNVQLQADVRNQVAGLAASRRRVVEAADAQRRRFEAQLRRGAISKLVEVKRALEECPLSAADNGFEAGLAATLEELESARAELEEFARGVRPPLLTEAGLGSALADLAARAAVPIEITVCEGRFPAPVEAVAYFVCAEALTNVAKYARAHSASITLERGAGTLAVTIADDGVGGATPGAGTGLLGLRDRVEALGGRLQLESPRGRGTQLKALVPIGGD